MVRLTENVVLHSIVVKVRDAGYACDTGQDTNSKDYGDCVLCASRHFEVFDNPKRYKGAGQVGKNCNQGEGVTAYEDDPISTAFPQAWVPFRGQWPTSDKQPDNSRKAATG